METKGKGEGLLFVGKVSVSSLADEQTAAAERRMNGETEASERDIVSLKTQKGLGKLKLGFIFSQKMRKKLCHVSHVLHGLGKLKLDWRTDTNEMTWGRFFSHELPRIIREWLARVLMSRRKRGKRRRVLAS